MEVEVIGCGDEHDMWEALSWNNRKWGGANFGEVAFRGQRCSDWRLNPRSYREAECFGYQNRVLGPFRDSDQRSQAESQALKEFLDLADRVGLPIRGDGPDLRQAIAMIPDSAVDRTWPKSRLWEVLAIAQHHGIPTRLLDFTYDPYIAAYFASRGAFEHQRASDCDSDRFAVWMVDLRFIWRDSQESPSTGARVTEIKVPRASNKFLHAQHGLFLIDTCANQDWDAGSCHPLDAVVCDRAEYRTGQEGIWDRLLTRDSLPPVKKIEAPVDCAAGMLRLLHKRGLTLAHLMPDYSGVAEALGLFRKLGQAVEET